MFYYYGFWFFNHSILNIIVKMTNKNTLIETQEYQCRFERRLQAIAQEMAGRQPRLAERIAKSGVTVDQIDATLENLAQLLLEEVA